MSEQTCPCGYGQYATCCQPLHQGLATAQSAAQLMRSRYSAFAKHQIDYIVKTTALGQQQQLDQTALDAWSRHNQWQQLEIINSLPKLDKAHAMVEFKAYYFDGQENQIHHEKSYFVYHANQWFFLDPTLPKMLSMKQVCLCGSGKKFKHCCATFL